jgi:acyl-coenzyme A thioesterase PaaI-like protein
VPNRRFRHLPTCFGCGTDNDASLGTRIDVDAGRVRGTVALGDRYVGAPGLVHGGILATLLDEVMGAVPLTSTSPRVTASLDVRFRAPVKLGRELVVEAELGETSERDCIVHGTIRYAGGPADPRVVGTARYVVVQAAKRGVR